MTSEYAFYTVDFRPAPSGWRIAYATTLGSIVEPMPGWIVREEVECNTNTGDVVTRSGLREVVAAGLVEYEVTPANEIPDFWYVIGPGNPDPTPEEIEEEIARRVTQNESSLPPWCGECGLNLAFIDNTFVPAAKFNPRFRQINNQSCATCHPACQPETK